LIPGGRSTLLGYGGISIAAYYHSSWATGLIINAAEHGRPRATGSVEIATSDNRRTLGGFIIKAAEHGRHTATGSVTGATYYHRGSIGGSNITKAAEHGSSWATFGRKMIG
jgi:hypothetical protein